ncbi:thioredoxin domain-containing protein [Novosphingobium kaempferiae]|uniref:thioredoxin domain-containing protein n=1 Tax=Novosphingobium kaempferiae TaxID=2896849 RepID=UPI001E2DCFED|nr:thioredoxin domain-containing protein [Novosphingobium kaempferiae]
MTQTTFRAVALAACAVLSIAAAPKSAPKKGLPATSSNWGANIGTTANGSHRIGNPEAPLKLVEYVSYTCPHCAHFVKESEPVLRLTMIPKGQISITVTNFLRNPLDLTVAMLTNCGDPKRFFVRHNAFFASQEKWLAKAQAANREQQERWYQGELPARMRAISSDLGFYDTVAAWGLSRSQADQCLADTAMLDKLRGQQTDIQALNLQGTPSFTLNGQLLDGHDWATVQKAITEKQAQQRAGNI